jgi:hypothetical protein
VRGEIEVSASSRYMKWFISKFNLPSTAETMEQITETVRHALRSQYQEPFSRRKTENVLCKTYQSRTGSLSDQTFCDLAFLGQMLFTCEGNGLRISFPSNMEAEDIFVNLYLVKKWAFQNTLLSVDDIVAKLGISDKGVPSANEASAWSVPEAIMFGRAKTKLDFEVAHKVPVTCGSYLQTSLQHICRSLRG